MSEKRDYKRFEANTTAILTKGKSGPEPFLLENISARGAGILGYKFYPSGDKVTISFTLPFFIKRSIQKQAKVVWGRAVRDGVWEYGLDFGTQNLLLHFQPG